MINFLQTGTNNFVIYCDAVNEFDETYFLLGVQNVFTKEWFYVYPTIIKRNRRFVEFCLALVAPIDEDVYDGKINLSPNGFWDYKVWSTNALDLNPANGNLVETGQMELLTQNPEIVYESYISDNEDFASVVYISPIPDYCLIWNLTRNLWNREHTLWNGCSASTPSC
jgi:hypothetical protein